MKLNLNVNNLDCAHCAGVIEEEINKLESIKKARLNLLAKKLTVEVEDDINETELINSLSILAGKIEEGVTVTPMEKISPSISKNEVNDFSNTSCCSGSCCCSDEKNISSLRAILMKIKKYSFNFEEVILIIGIILFILTFFLAKGSSTRIIFSMIAYFIVGYDVLYLSLANLKKKNFLDENFLMSIATIGAIYLGEYSEAIGVMIFYKIGEYFQEKAVESSRNSIESLLNLQVVTANLKNSDGSVSIVSPEDLKVGNVVLVKAGENIPVDGIILKGSSSLNTASLTGESLPLSVEKGEEVLSGSLNIESLLEIQVTKEYENSTIRKIIRLIEESQESKPVAEKFISKFAKYYTPIVVSIAIVVALIFPIFMGDFTTWFSRALIFLVISCPCAVVLSVPLTFFSSIGYASRNGILIKGGNFLEKLTEVDSVVFDKTGTLTENDFQVENIILANNVTKEKLMEVATSGEIYSNHPLARTLLKYTHMDINKNLIEEYKEISGKGVSLKYKNQNVLVGNKKLMKENNIDISTITTTEDNSIIYISENNILLGAIEFSGIIKSNSKKAIEELKLIKYKTFMLTGDNKNVALKVGTSIGLNQENIYSELLPQDKVTSLKEIQTNSKSVVFVGDGINDAPSLALSDVGIAMGGVGSDIAIESADIVLMQDDPYKVVEVLKLAKLNRRVVTENIVFSLGIKILVMILGILGFANMWMAIFADVGVSMIAVLNASKILRIKKL